MLGLLLILIPKSWGGGVSPALLSVGAVCVYMYVSWRLFELAHLELTLLLLLLGI
jgi:hypothetical protein